MFKQRPSDTTVLTDMASSMSFRPSVTSSSTNPADDDDHVGAVTPTSVSPTSSIADAIDEEQQTPSNRSPTKVTFDTIEIRHYPIQIGIQSIPADRGAPIGIGWEYTVEYVDKVDVYESVHKLQPTKNKHQLLLDPSDRMNILLEQGISMRDIKASMNICEQIKKDRIVNSKRTASQDKWTILMEKTKKKFGGKKRSSLQQQQLQQYLMT